MKFYQEFSRYYDFIFPFKEVKLNFLQEKLPAKGRLLDLATGTGTYPIALAGQGYQISAIDLSEQMINIANKKAEQEGVNIDFQNADMKEIDQLYSNEDFDLISCIGNSLVHLDGIKELTEVITKIYSLLKEEGTFALQIVNYDRILAKNITELPTIEAENGVKLTRKYELQEGRVEFKTTLKTDEGEFNNSVLLYPLTSDKLKEILFEVGFEEVRLYGSFQLDDYKPLESFPLVVRAEK
ncbi:class I SAM-dependent methyltransferase [Natroniella sulfidigena]|uniref:class I SAM-dependent methyltransferase n=1 Tax=Natroniella sulfidigena TaxID=723921 RepID=UPI00200A1E8E|nr:class I SAM-dependent methyltransferase [Natroniella sulfidigena]MCK8817251.1 class I SAM-dependent methyltransferase [Natroniella sulfidigena]